MVVRLAQIDNQFAFGYHMFTIGFSLIIMQDHYEPL